MSTFGQYKQTVTTNKQSCRQGGADREESEETNRVIDNRNNSIELVIITNTQQSNMERDSCHNNSTNRQDNLCQGINMELIISI